MDVSTTKLTTTVHYIATNQVNSHSQVWLHHSHVHCNQYHTYYDIALDIPYMYEGIQSTYEHVSVYITQYKVNV